MKKKKKKKKKMKKKRFVFLLSTKKKKKKKTSMMMMERCSLALLPSQSSRLPSSQTLVAVGGDPALVDDVDTFFFCPLLFL